MVPRTRIDALPRNATPERVKQLLLESGHSRMPVYDGALENVVGYVTAKDVLALDWERQLIVLDDILRPAVFLLESLEAPDVLRELQARHAGLAFVMDADGTLLGLLTLEDVIEELIGEIVTEDETREEPFVREEGGAALVRGDAAVRDVNRRLPATLPEDDRWSTVAGLCITLAGRIPEKGFSLTTEGMENHHWRRVSAEGKARSHRKRRPSGAGRRALTSTGWRAAAYDVPLWCEPKVARDHFAQVARALYSLPTRFIGKGLTARADKTLVRFYQGAVLVKTHARQPPRGRSIDVSDFPEHKTPYALRDIGFLQREAARHGEAVGAFGEKLLEGPLPWTRMRRVYALLGLARRYGDARLDEACNTALDADMIDVRRLEQMLRLALPDAQTAAAAPVIPLARYLRPPPPIDSGSSRATGKTRKEKSRDDDDHD
jgi:hypothetical protein